MSHTRPDVHTSSIESPNSGFFLHFGSDNLLQTLEKTLDPFALISSLLLVAYVSNGHLDPDYLLLSLLVFSLTFPGTLHLQDNLPKLLRRVVFGWLGVAGLLLFFGFSTQYIRRFDSNVIIIWLWLAPATQVGLHLLIRVISPKILSLQGNLKRIAICGMNEQGIALSKQILNDPYSGKHIVGFFDDRMLGRSQGTEKCQLLGKISDVPACTKSLRIDVLYLSLPMTTHPRILDLLDELRDTTVSVYFVPDAFVTDLIQGRMDMVGQIPVVAVCETPFTGLNGLLKRSSDIVLSLLILLMISPVMVGIAIGIKAGSPGPAIFKQRRYGLSGEDIVVYKFRSMSVCEDGNQITQATKNDNRITPIGAFLRSTSLDELPQFINVLQGRMSIVGPRPHAVAHNELYRKLIKGYMVRHKVRPGVTGWAQVNGLRGETDTLEKMKARIEYDLDYLRNWSLPLVLKIIIKTVGVVFKRENAY